MPYRLGTNSADGIGSKVHCVMDRTVREAMEMTGEGSAC